MDSFWRDSGEDPGSPTPVGAVEVPVRKEFPRSQEVPTGCMVVDDLGEDDFLYPVMIHQETYVTRVIDKMHGGGSTDLPIWFFTPRLNDMPVKRNITAWPTVVFVRGSGFGPQTVLDYLNYYVRIAERGYVVAALQYRSSNIAPFPAQMQDCKTAVRYVRKHAKRLHVDVNRIGLWGDSSGGTTVLQAGFTGDSGPDTDVYSEYSAAVNCIIDWYGVTDMTAMNYYPNIMDNNSPDGPIGKELGGISVLDHPDLAAAASPITYLRRDVPTPPTLIMHGGRDSDVPFNQSCRLFRRMKELGKEVSFIKLNDGTHGYYGFRTNRAMDIVDMYLQSHL
ncbi:alpha/beta hydrolase [Bifidobacterium samirii]|nr:alpha/beta hydrolase [Bifidobacterium samirii]